MPLRPNGIGGPWLDRLAGYFGELRIAQFDRPEKIRPIIRRWRNRYAHTPRTADSHNRPWTRDGFGSSFNKAKLKAGIGDLHFHDLRGTAATRFYVAGLQERVIAEIMGWEEEHVTRIIRRYVGRTAAVKAIIAQLDQAKRRT